MSYEKDATELELERRIFGNDDGFFESIRNPVNVIHPSIGATTAKESNAVHVKEDSLQTAQDADLFFFDTGASPEIDTSPISQDREELENPSIDAGSIAWIDSDDERLQISLASTPRLRKFRVSQVEDLVDGREFTKRLRRQYERLYHKPRWAAPSATKRDLPRMRYKANARSSDDGLSTDESLSNVSDEDNQLSAQPLERLLQSITNLTTTPDSHMVLRPGTINVHRLKDVGNMQPSAIMNLSFHPTQPILLTSGPSSTLSLHHVSPQSPSPNPLLASLHLRSTPLTASQFRCPNGHQIFFSGRRRYYHVWDLGSGKVRKITRLIGHQEGQKSMERFKLSPCGRWIGLVSSSRKGGGFVNIVNAGTNQWVAEVRVEGKGGVADFVWWRNGDGMVVLGKGGEAIEWNANERQVVARWVDEGAVGVTVMAMDGLNSGPKALGGDRWLAVGSSSGIVNIYDRRKWASSGQITIPGRPQAVRAFDQLTTPTSNLAFSPNGQILCIASRWKRDALRLVHLPSCTVYRNWPTAQTPLGRITSVGWSPDGNTLAIGNEQGKVRLWEVRH